MPTIVHRGSRSIASLPRLAHAAIVALLAIAALAAPLALAVDQLACVSPVATSSA